MRTSIWCFIFVKRGPSRMLRFAVFPRMSVDGEPLDPPSRVRARPPVDRCDREAALPHVAPRNVMQDTFTMDYSACSKKLMAFVLFIGCSNNVREWSYRFFPLGLFSAHPYTIPGDSTPDYMSASACLRRKSTLSENVTLAVETKYGSLRT